MIDWDRVHSLRNDIGAKEFDEIVDIFLEEVQDIVARMSSDSTRDNLEYDLHALKNGALNLGFDDVAKLCQSGEKMAASGNADQIDLAQITSAFDDARRVFVSELPAQFAA